MSYYCNCNKINFYDAAAAVAAAAAAAAVIVVAAVVAVRARRSYSNKHKQKMLSS
jgi:hypothetical protein